MRENDVPANHIDDFTRALGYCGYFSRPYSLASGTVIVPLLQRPDHVRIRRTSDNTWQWQLLAANVVKAGEIFHDRNTAELPGLICDSLLKAVYGEANKAF